MAEEPEKTYDNIREILGSLIGAKVVDITQHDHDELVETKKGFIQIHFDNGEYLKFFIGDDGFDHNCLEVVDEAEEGKT